jgi:DNA-directed RNA polymerase specialized sigma24 family protein
VWLAPALDGLSPLLRQAVELRVLGELSYEEVARQSGCSPGVARVRVCRALSRLSESAMLAGTVAASSLVERNAS